MPRHVQGRRVESIEDIERGGDYVVKRNDAGAIESLWFAIPGFPEQLWNRIGGPGSKDTNRWQIDEGPDGAVTVSPSILTWWTWGPEKAERRFHGFLRQGIWEILDDTVGAQFD